MHSDTNIPSHSSPSRLDTYAWRIFLTIVTLSPLVFLPTPYISQDMIKVVTIVLGILLSFILLVGAMRREREYTLPPRQIWWVGVLLVISIVVSALLSGHIDKSFFGQGFEFGTASFLAVLFLASLVTYWLVHKHLQRTIILYVCIVSSFLLILISQALYMLSPAMFGLSWAGRMFSFVGSWYSIGMLSMLIVFITLPALVYLPLSQRMKGIYVVVTILGILGTTIVFNRTIWEVAAIVFCGLMCHTFFLGSRGSSSPSSGKKLTWIFALACLISATFFWRGMNIIGPIIERIGLSYSEVTLSWRSTSDITAKVLAEKPIFGLGPNRFTQAYVMHKPLEINQSPIWDAEFVSAFGVLPTFLVTQGFVGSLAWIIFLVLFFVLVIRVMLNLPHEPERRFVLVSSSAGALFLWLMMLLSTPSIPLIFYTFVMTGISVGTAVLCGIVKPYHLLLSSHTQLKNKILSFVPTALIILGVLWAGFYMSKSIALAYFASGLKQLTVATNPDAAQKSFRHAARLDRSDIYWRAEVEALLARANLFVASAEKNKKPLSQEDALSVVTMINDALSAARKAIAYDSENYYNHLSEVRAFETAAILKMDGAVDGAIQSYKNAIQTNPTNPRIHLNLARFQASQSKLDDALQSAGAAIRLKSNYLDAIFLMSQIQVAKGNLQDAITSVQLATEIDPSNPLLHFQLGFLYYSAKQYVSASKALEHALELEPSYANAQYFLGLSYVYQNRRNDAIQLFEKLMMSNPESSEVELILANIKSGKAPFTDAAAPVTSTPEKRITLPLEEESL